MSILHSSACKPFETRTQPCASNLLRGSSPPTSSFCHPSKSTPVQQVPLESCSHNSTDYKTFEVKSRGGTGSEYSWKCYNVPCLGIMCGKWLVPQTLLQISNPIKGSWVHLIKDYMWLVGCKVESTTCIINEYSHSNAALSRDWTRWPLRPVPTRMIFWLSHLYYANR